MGKHADIAPRRLPRPSARALVPVAAGVVTFGAVTAFAASLSVNSKTLSSGNASVSACNASATVTYSVTYSAAIPGYKVAQAPVSTAAACANMAYRVTLTGSGNASLGEITGTLDASGAGTPDFSALNVAAASVTGVSVVVSG